MAIQLNPNTGRFTTDGDWSSVTHESVTPLDVAALQRRAQGDKRRREVLESNLADAMRRRALHRRTGNIDAYRKADRQVDRYLDLIDLGVAMGRWEK